MDQIIWALVIIALGGPDGGRAIDSSNHYATEESCKAAAKIVNAQKVQTVWAYSVPSNGLYGFCIPVDQ